MKGIDFSESRALASFVRMRQQKGEDSSSLSLRIDEEGWEAMASEVVKNMVIKSPFFQTNAAASLPTFDPSEIVTGKVLGQGEFGTVREVTRIADESQSRLRQLRRMNSFESGTLASDHVSGADKTDEVDANSTTIVYDAKDKVRERCWREGKARYAVKRMRDDLNGEERVTAALDLACEAKFLASIDHPNIIRLRATAGRPGAPDFMLVLDELHSIMTDRIEIWKEMELAFKGCLGCGMRRDESFYPLFAERLTAAFDVARALNFLHRHRILYRDLKPHNIGFHARGTLRLFDFGVARELKAEDLVKAPDDYNCTERTGTMRYMAPEVYLGKPYGLKSDVYSFGLFLWELCTLQKPYREMGPEQLENAVMNRGFRPFCPGWIPKTVRKMIQGCWHNDPSKRPTLNEICRSFPNCILEVERRRASSRDSILDRSSALRAVSERSFRAFVKQDARTNTTN